MPGWPALVMQAAHRAAVNRTTAMRVSRIKSGSPLHSVSLCSVACARVVSARAAAGDHGWKGGEQNLQIEQQRPALDVLDVELDPVLELDLVAARDLPQTGDARPHAESPAVVELVLLDFGRHRGPGPHQA